MWCHFFAQEVGAYRCMSCYSNREYNTEGATVKAAEMHSTNGQSMWVQGCERGPVPDVDGGDACLGQSSDTHSLSCLIHRTCSLIHQRDARPAVGEREHRARKTRTES